ncbi:hypothetical protein O7635_22230 [Asanoa sp. WMMD1127]|uniref:hypothetical protein n=1 Tax=Asanoa sp. WMMD1127 TaxID=3016107 RepID=UPI002417B5B9|nr:hypothetical protein [Asanoa sp. WMMD1127]MDG4824576.1 hypothetical protein [Asanoa sp. WMMD1127]
MFARSSTINAQPSSIDPGITFVGDELMDEMLAIDGCVGLSLLVDRRSGRCIATSSWADEAAMHASESRVPPLRQRLMSAFGATDITNEEWDVVVMHRAHRAPDGAQARLGFIRSDPARTEESIDIYKSVLPDLEAFDGFCSASLLLNRSSGRAVSNVIYDSGAALAASADRAQQLRTRATGRMGADVTEVAEFELAFAHLRVPELV